MTRFDSSARPDDDARSGISENAEGTTITPIEAVISKKDSSKLHRQAEFAEQIIEERQKRVSEPVHLAGLKPLPAEMRKNIAPSGVIPGGPDALSQVPSMRRAVPPPYQRPRISIDHHGKTWAYLQAHQVREGDIVVDFGKILSVTPYLRHETRFNPDTGRQLRVATHEGILLTNIAGGSRDHNAREQLRVFRVHEEDDGERSGDDGPVGNTSGAG